MSNLLSSAEVADALGLSRRQAQHLMKTGVIPAEKLGRDWFARPENLTRVERRPAGRPRGKKRKVSEP